MADIAEAQHHAAIPGLQWQQTGSPGVLAADNTLRTPVFVAPFNCEIVHIFVVNSTLVTGNATNSKQINFIDGGAEGAGTDELSNLDLTGSQDLEIGKTDISPAAEHFMSLGDILEIELEDKADGVLIKPILVLVGYRPANLTS